MRKSFIKKLSAYMLFLVIQGNAINLSAQFQTIKTPKGDVTIYTPRPTPHYLELGNKEIVNRKYDYTVVLLNDSIFEVTSRINIYDSIHSLEYGKKSKKNIIKPGDTKEIYRMEGIKKVKGIPSDSCWLFLIDDGKIKTYSITSELDDPLIQYVQKGKDGEMLLFTRWNVMTLVKDNKKAHEKAEIGKLSKAVKIYNEED